MFRSLSGLCGFSILPVSDVAFVLSNNEAEPFQAFQVFVNSIELFLGDVAFELGGDLLGCPVAGGGAQQVADGGELGFGFGGPLLLLDRFDDGFFFGEDAGEGGLLGFLA
ncbi:MAG: hypothetical protein AAGC93_24815 [Cyanobacteria bacterium P01_F01_bin.53]